MSLLGPLVEWCAASPLDHMDWLPAQHAYLSSRSRRRLLRAGNQAHGKTTVGCAELIWRLLGWHPYRLVPKPPVHWWAISSSMRSSGILQSKFWALVPKAEVDPRTWYDETKGQFVGHDPICRFRNGSIVEFRWTGSRTLNLASASLDGVWFDEPPARHRAFSEVERRLTRTGGDLLMTLTPVNAPVDYLQELTGKGKVEDLHFPLRADLLVPVGLRSPISTDDGTPMDEAWIQEQREMVASWEAPVILDGEWEFRTVGNAFEAWDPTRMVCIPRFPAHPLKLALGTDYGGESLRQCSVLVAVDESTEYPTIYALDEYMADGATSIEEDAAAVIAMLARNGIRWADLDHVFGDKKWEGRRGDLTSKSNEDFQRAIEDRLKLKRNALRPVVQNVKRGRDAGSGSRERGVRFLHQAMVRRDGLYFQVHPRCQVLIRALGRWDWTEEMKDPIDALRYSLRHWIFWKPRIVLPSTVRIRS